MKSMKEEMLFPLELGNFHLVCICAFVNKTARYESITRTT